MSTKAEAVITAGLKPELFSNGGVFAFSRTSILVTLTILVVAGFAFRFSGLSVESLSEDELNKLEAVSEYRSLGLTAANSEHPFLMKALQTVSIVAAERWNQTFTGLHIQTETALRLPSVIFGALTVVLIYLLVLELFGTEVALLAAALWTFDPNAIGFNRIAKEDTFLLFFFLLANIFWLLSQRAAEDDSGRRPEPYYWATAAAYGAMMASKYLPSIIAVSICYYWMFQAVPETKWRLGKKKMLRFFLVIGIVFLILNPTILLPETWRQMSDFAGQRRMAHDGYEFMGTLYSHRWTDWLRGTPWYFYPVFIAVKLPFLTVLAFLVGLPLLFRRTLGDGRYFILMWMFVWLMTFGFAGGKFMRYLTVMLPGVLITAALGVQFVGRQVAHWISSLTSSANLASYFRIALAVVVVLGSLSAAFRSAPHYRLYTNAIGGSERAGYYFPHDEFYDSSMRDIMFELAKQVRKGAQIASETPRVAAFYAEQAGRNDLSFISLSDNDALQRLGEEDVIIDARGRRYFSNDALISALRRSGAPALEASLGPVSAASVYVLDQNSLRIVQQHADQPH